MSYLQENESSIAGISDVGALTAKGSDGKRDPNKITFVQTARRQAKRNDGNNDQMKKSWQMASSPYNPWGYQLKDPIKLDPQEIYRDTSIPVTGFAGGSTIFIEAGKLIDAGMSPNIILGGVTAEDIDELIARGDLELDVQLH